MSLFPKSVRVPIDTIRTSSGKLAELADRVQDYFDQLGNLSDGLSSDGTWQGNDAAAFIKANASNQKKFNKTIQSLSEMAKILDVYCTVMENTDKEWANKIRAVG